jgi:hypothetical protein
MRSFALCTTPNPFKTHSAHVPGSGLVQIAVSSMLRLDSLPSTQLYLRSTVDTALQIYRQLRREFSFVWNCWFEVGLTTGDAYGEAANYPYFV